MSEPFLAEIKIVAFNFPPRGWAMCNGQILPINQNQALFSLLGTTYGGDGRVNFRLPEMRGRVPIHSDNTHPLGNAGGAENHALVKGEMPMHTHGHGGVATTGEADRQHPVGSHFAHADIETYAKAKTVIPLNPDALSSAVGGSQPHANMQPYLTLNFVIALQGIFPSRN